MKEVLTLLFLMVTMLCGQSFASEALPKVQYKITERRPINWIGGMIVPQNPKFIAGEYYITVFNYPATADQVYQCIDICVTYDGDLYTILTWLDMTWGLENITFEPAYGYEFYME